MTVKEFRDALASNPGAKMHWMLPDKSFVPVHCHITEVRNMPDFRTRKQMYLAGHHHQD
jgi:hypothetical protein